MNIEINDRSPVLIDNLFPWDVSFHSDTMRSDVIVPGSVRGFGRMTFYDVLTEVRVGNVAFAGIDGAGSHAAFRIVDDEVYKQIFGTDKRPVQMTADILHGVTKCKTRGKLIEYLNKNFVTRAEKKALNLYVKWLTEDITGDLPNYFFTEIDKHYYSTDDTETGVGVSPLPEKPVFN